MKKPIRSASSGIFVESTAGILSAKLASLQAHAANLLRGREKWAVIEICRTLDLFAAISLASEEGPGERRADAYFARYGVAAALQPFLPVIESDLDGVPWRRSEQKSAHFFYSYVVECGKLSYLSRLARLEKYGLARTIAQPGRIDIYVRQDSRERVTRNFFRTKISEKLSPPPVPRSLRRRMHRHVKPCSSFFIKYDNDFDIVNEYILRAKEYGQSFLEAEALPDDFVIGGRAFSAWKLACEQTLGRILAHIDFAAALCKKYPETNLRDVITIFSRRDDTRAVWIEAGLAPHDVAPTMRALTLNSDDLSGWTKSFEPPTSPYIALGRDFVLLPAFGVLINPYFSLFRHLRSAYRSEWDRGVDLREEIFRSDIAKQFPLPKFLVPKHGFKIKRDDGTQLTDLDAVICDQETGSLAIIQLKWHDPYGRSLSERESRRKNLAEATEWVQRITCWVNGRTAGAVAKALGLKITHGKNAPEIYVVSRYSAQFSGDERDDGGALWVSWPELVALSDNATGADPISEIPRLAAEVAASIIVEDAYTTAYEFKSLVVYVHVEGQTSPHEAAPTKPTD